MSAKILPSLTDESRDLQKQIGCMNGIFQLFDRHYFLIGRRSAGHNRKRLLPGANNSGEIKTATEKASVRFQGKNLEAVQDQPRVSTESLGTSFSSSTCSSAFTSIDHRKTQQSSFLGSQNEVPVKQQSPSLHFGQPSPDLRDVVKDSMKREYRGISVKTAVREEGRGRTLKHIDSPRPFQQFKTVQPRVSESLCNCKVEKDASLQQLQKEPPRFSYDERVTRDSLKSATKLKELPRLSLDSKQSSLRSSASESRSNFLLRELQRQSGTDNHIVNANQEPGSNKRPSNVVVKLMGLEAFPDTVTNDEGETMKVNSRQEQDIFAKSSKKSEKSKKNPALSQQIVHKDLTSPASKNARLRIKPTSSPRFPLEPAPWRQPDAIDDSPRKGPATWSNCRNTPPKSSSVYGEIEKRITELEFRKSGKDLRALKQILEAMQNTRKKLDNQEGEQADLKSETSRYSSDCSSCNDQGFKPSKWQSNKTEYLGSPKVTSSPKRFNSSILMEKPATIMDNSRNSSTSSVPADASDLPKLQTRDILYTRRDSVGKIAAKDPTPKRNTAQNSKHCKPSTDEKINGKILKVVQTARATQLENVENYTVSPRFQQKNHGIEKQPHLTIPIPDSGRRRSKLREPDSLNRKVRPESTKRRHKDKKIRDFSHQSDTASIQSESNSSLTSLTETEVTSTESSTEIEARKQVDQKERNGGARLYEDMPLAELVIVPPEQPSPVSVLDATFYREDSPSPVKKISTVFTEYGTQNSDEADWQCLGDEFNQKKFENIKHLVHKLRMLETVADEASMLDFASLSNRPSSDHKYITKMLLVSGLLQDIRPVPTAIQLHPSGHLINPDLFHVLEQTELNNMPVNKELNQKIHRKIVFDTVNEILVRKLASESPFIQRKRTRIWQEVLREIYSEVDDLQAKAFCSLNDDDGFISILNADMARQPDGWADYLSEIPAVVLDIERLIFKDLITEVITAHCVQV